MQNREITVPNCPHLNQIENFENSFLVCRDCGLEVQQIYCNPPLWSSDEKWFNERSFFKTYADKQFDFIDNCIRRDKIPDSCVYEIYDYYLKIKSETKQKTKLNEVAAVAIYNWKKKTLASGLSADDVSAITHVKKKDLFRCENRKRGRVRFNNVKSILSTVSIEELGLQHKDRLLIASVCSRFEDNDCSPKSISAALVQLYISLCGKKSTNDKIIKLFNISNMTLYRTKKKIKKKANPILTRLIEQNLSNENSLKNAC